MVAASWFLLLLLLSRETQAAKTYLRDSNQDVWTVTSTTDHTSMRRQRPSRTPLSAAYTQDDDEEAAFRMASVGVTSTLVANKPVRILATYTNRVGRQQVLDQAMQVHHEFDNVLAVNVSPRAVKRLQDSPHVTIERDSLWVEQGWREPTRRRLQETTPYGITMVQADQVETGPHAATVCIVDTGLALGHPDIAESRVAGTNRRSSRTDEILYWNQDQRGHGTHVAGTLTASNNTVGVRGMGELRLFITRGLDDQGSAYESDIRQAMTQCATAGARVVNLSLGGKRMSSAMEKVVSELYDANILVFAAAGNAGELSFEFPASDPKVVSVSAVDESEWYWSLSNYGPALELMAPGHAILSTSISPEGEYSYAEYSGTSMATPHASGAAALLWSHYPDCTNQQIRYALAYSAKDKGEVGCDGDFGYGIVQVKDALDFLALNPCATAEWGRLIGSGNCSTIDAEPETRSVDVQREGQSREEPTASPTWPATDYPTLPATDYPTEYTDYPTESPTLPATDFPTSNTLTVTEFPIVQMNKPTSFPTRIASEAPIVQMNKPISSQTRIASEAPIVQMISPAAYPTWPATDYPTWPATDYPTWSTDYPTVPMDEPTATPTWPATEFPIVQMNKPTSSPTPLDSSPAPSRRPTLTPRTRSPVVYRRSPPVSTTEAPTIQIVKVPTDFDAVTSVTTRRDDDQPPSLEDQIRGMFTPFHPSSFNDWIKTFRWGHKSSDRSEKEGTQTSDRGIFGD